MSKVFIEKYDGFDIYFDTQLERFQFDLEGYSGEKQSFAACINSIKQYKKENDTFKPFDVQNEEGETATITGVYKNGNFVCNKDGKLDQISKYSTEYWFLYKEQNQPIFTRVKEIQNKIKEYQLERGGILKALTKTTLKDIQNTNNK